MKKYNYIFIVVAVLFFGLFILNVHASTSWAVGQIALLSGQSKGEMKPIVKNIILTTHGNLISSQIFSESYSVADDREVYLAILEGNFQFNRVRSNMEPIQSQQINIEIDASTGEVLALGTSELTKDSRVINNLKLLTDN